MTLLESPLRPGIMPQPTSQLGCAGDASPTGLGASATNPKMRKRTKTGCLTCRKRRIKCGEERPTCGNCIKSKRQCEGYNQRVVFKPPIGDWPNHPGAVSTIQYHTSMLPGSRNQPFRPPQLNTSTDGARPSIQPRPFSSFDFSSSDATSGVPPNRVNPVLVGASHPYSHDSNYHESLSSPLHPQPLTSPHHSTHISPTSASYFPHPSPVHTSPPTQFTGDASASYQPSLPYSQGQSYPPVSIAFDSPIDAKPSVPQSLPQPPLYQHTYPSGTQAEPERGYPSQSVSARSEQYPQYTEVQPGLQRFNSQPQAPGHLLRVGSDLSQPASYTLPPASSHADYRLSTYPSAHIPVHDMISDVKYMPQPVLENDNDTLQALEGHTTLGREVQAVEHSSPTQILNDAAVENEDDDYWDVRSDEEMEDLEPEDNESVLLASKDFDSIRCVHRENFNEMGIRRYDAFLYDGLLTKYRPEYAANPLRNPKTARVFAHYLHVTGPILSIYERNPSNPSLIFDGAVPASQQCLWTYTLPLRALGHQGLLHAMLALASLHIARLQGASITPSYKHYAYSLKCLGRSLGDPSKRHSISTLATSLLLAYYEVWTAEHVKWSTHLVGAARLITELDYRALTREAQRFRAAQASNFKSTCSPGVEVSLEQDEFHQGPNEAGLALDEGLVSTIVGKQICYNGYGAKEGDAERGTRTAVLEALDLKSYETLQDLHWWYARHDIYQSIVSGNPLIIPYRKWSDCPPRAPLGRGDALYGSHDHLVLLIGRIADFTVRDRERKVRQVEVDGAWKPRPGMPGFENMTRPATAGPMQNGHTQTPTTPLSGSSQMQFPPPEWTGPPPDWNSPPPSGFDPPPPSIGQSAPGFSPPSQLPGNRNAPTIPNFYGMAPSQPPAPLSTSYKTTQDDCTPTTPNTPHQKCSELPSAYDAAMVQWNNISAAHADVAQVLATSSAFSPLPTDFAPPAPGGRDTNITPFGPSIIYRSFDISVIWMLLHLAKIILIRSHPAMPPAALMAAGISATATQSHVTLIGRIAASMQLPLGESLSPLLGSAVTEAVMPLFFAGIQFQAPDQREWLITRLWDVDRKIGCGSAGLVALGCEVSWEKAASMGRGPKYVRRTQLIEKDEDADSTWPSANGAQAVAEEMRHGTSKLNVVRKPPRNDNRAAAAAAHTRQTSQSGQSITREVKQSGNHAALQEGSVVKMSMQTSSENPTIMVKNASPNWGTNLLETEEDLQAGMERVGISG